MSRAAKTPAKRRTHATNTDPAPAPDEWITVEEFCTEVKITRRTFDRWRAKGEGPRFIPLGGHGPLRSKRSWVDSWALGENEVA